GVTAAGHDIHDQPTIADAVKSGGGACRQRRRNQAGAKGDDEFHALGERRERRPKNPCIIAVSSSWQQRPFETETIYRLRDLLKIFKISGAPTHFRAEIPSVIAASGQKPVNFHEIAPCRS